MEIAQVVSCDVLYASIIIPFMYFIVGSDDDDVSWMDSMGIMQGRTTIMYPYVLL